LDYSELKRTAEQIDAFSYLSESFRTSDFNYEPEIEPETPINDYKKELENKKRISETIKCLKEKNGFKPRQPG